MSGAVEHYLSSHEALAPQLPGAELGWLASMRTHGLEHFRRVGFPTTRQEDWKYTGVTPIEKRNFSKASVEQPALSMNTHRIGGLDCHELVFVDGRYSAQMSSLGLDTGDITVTPLAQAITGSPTLLEQHLGKHASMTQSGFSALNTAFIDDGAVIHLKAGAALDKPLTILFISSGQTTDMLSQPRVLIVAESGASATVIERYVSATEAVYLNNVVTEVVLGEGANLEHYKLQEECDKAFHIATLQVSQADSSRFVSYSISLGARLARNEINSQLGEHAICELYGLYMATGRQHMDFHTRVDHTKPHGVSKEFYKGVLDGRGRGVFNGQVYVHPDAQKTDAEQANNNLLLSRHAEIDTKPQLEIYADDVKCAHGATVGQLDDNMVFYLRSRGIDATAARGLLTYGFASEVFESMGSDAVRKHLHDALVEWLPNAEQVRELVT